MRFPYLARRMAELHAQLATTLGRAYTVERELGGGGMARVFVATEKRSVVGSS